VIEVVRFAKSNGPLTKRISLSADGKLINDSSACIMPVGIAARVKIKRLEEFAKLVGGLGSHEAIAAGRLQTALEHVEVCTKAKLNGQQRPDLIARTRGFIDYAAGEPALTLIDFDQKGMPSTVASKVSAAGGLWPALVSVTPELAGVERIERSSTSAGLFNAKTGARFPGSGGVHVYVTVKDGSDSERFLKALHDRCWIAGLGWYMVGAGGQLLERSCVDRMVGQPERLIFEGAPDLIPPLKQDKAARKPVVFAGETIDTVQCCPPLTIVETARLNELRAKAAFALAPERAKAREIFIKEQGDKIVRRTGMGRRMAARVAARQCDAGILLPDVDLPFDDTELAGATVADVLADPASFEGATLADPVEGLEYGRSKAMIMRRADGPPWIHSFAHGRSIYELRLDFAAAKRALESAPTNEAARAFVDLVMAADLEPDEIESLRDIAAQRAGVGKRTLDQMLKAARQEEHKRKAEEDRRRRAAARQDPRPQFLVPRNDAAWRPVMALLNEVAKSVVEAEPLGRDLEGFTTRVVVRRAPKLHLLLSKRAQPKEVTAEIPHLTEHQTSRLPAPELPLLCRYTPKQLAERIESFSEFVDDTGRPVHLPDAFVGQFHDRPEDVELPTYAAVATLPIVLPDGTLLSGAGLNQDYGIVFRIAPELQACLPKPEDCTAAACAEAMRFLTDVFLCDVATTYEGKCVAIAICLTIIERSLLPSRPAFNVTSGQPESGKTTLISMLILAVLGVLPAAAAWSPSAEERRKAIVTYLEAGIPAVTWDNLPDGCRVECPHIEAACTAATISDRRLGLNELITTAAATIFMFTGINLIMAGALNSRTLPVRVQVDELDPASRPFSHPDPLGWTIDHRGEIIRHLYVLLLGNPLLHNEDPPQAETRFKDWMRMVGSAVEYGAKEHHARVKGMLMDKNAVCPAAPVNFQKIFSAQKITDESATALAEVLAGLAAMWPKTPGQTEPKLFRATQIQLLINPHVYDPNLGAEEREQHRLLSEMLRDLLFPKLPEGKTVTSTAVALKFRIHIDKPVRYDGKTLILKAWFDEHAKAGVYYVVEK
jgi:hypothetical protein